MLSYTVYSLKKHDLHFGLVF